jgi:hypothetical protein
MAGAWVTGLRVETGFGILGGVLLRREERKRGIIMEDMNLKKRRMNENEKMESCICNTMYCENKRRIST